MMCRARCSGCGENSRFWLIDPPKYDNEESINESRLCVYPSPPLCEPFEESIQEVSPAFVKIYGQAVAAEYLQFDKLNGMGYRKALEFLVKDYLCSKYPDKQDEIKTRFLGQCIRDYVDDPRIRDCAEMATWLGNDETHYQRRWVDKDIDDLKMLIQLTLHWISSALLTEQYKSSMGKV